MHNFDIYTKFICIYDIHYYNLLSESVHLIDYCSWLLKLKTSGFDTCDVISHWRIVDHCAKTMNLSAIIKKRSNKCAISQLLSIHKINVARPSSIILSTPGFKLTKEILQTHGWWCGCCKLEESVLAIVAAAEVHCHLCILGVVE